MDEPRFPKSVEAVTERLTSRDHRTWAVGGALRDALLGRPPRDYDFLVASPLEAARAALSEGRIIRARETALRLPRRGNRPQIEITSLAERGHSLEVDLRGREFTLNAIAFDLRDRAWCDPTGGISDLASRLLRASDPERTFRADPLRIVRGLRLAGELGLEVESATGVGMRRTSWCLHQVPGERLREELYRVLRLANASSVLEELRACGALAVLLPELLRSVGVLVPGSTGDVYRMCLELCDALRAAPELRLAGLLRGASVADSKHYLALHGEFQLQRVELHGAALVPPVAERLRLSRRQARDLEIRVRSLRRDPSDARGIRRMLERAGRDTLSDLLELRRAERARGENEGSRSVEWKALEARIRAVASDWKQQPLAIGGKDVVQTLRISEGREVGRWLRRLHWRVVQRPHENERERLVAWLRQAHQLRRAS